MAEVTVSELAKSVGASVDRLLTQMGQAGLPHTSAEDKVSDSEKQTLLGFLKTAGGAAAPGPKKITLKRKTTTTLKMGSGSARKTVNVEVRKKRTYVKRTDLDVEPDASELELAGAAPEGVAPTPAEPEYLPETPPEVPEIDPAPEIEPAAPEPEIVPEPEPEPAPEVPEVPPEPELPEVETPAPTPSAAPAPSRYAFVDDIEQRRIAAIAARRQAESVAAEAAKRAQEERKRREEERRTASAKSRAGAPAPAPAAPATPAAAADDADKKAARRRERPVVTTVVEEDDEANKGRHHKKAGKAVKKADVPLPKKGSAVLTYLDDDYDDGSGRGRRKRSTLKINNKHGFKKPTGKIVHEVELPESISVSELASRMSVKSGEVIKQLMRMGVMATLNQALDQETAQLVVEEFGHTAVLKSSNEMEENLREDFGGEGGERVPRAPVVTVMGHVDHGKTSLLDYIRNTKVTAGEVGGITQHIGAYRVPTSHGELAFLDTPGHAAFTAMRARGARATDIVILVVAADDGVMPQTEEAIQHARAAGVPIVVAINKCDKPSADPDRVKNELVARNVIPDDWGGDTQFVHVSALTGDGIDDLLEAVSLQAELLELTAPLDVPARGVVIESQMDRGRGAVATVLIQAGQLSTGQILLAGQSFGRVRAMTNERGEKVELAGPSTPVEILGLDIPPNAGDEFLVVPDERRAREMAQYRADKERQERQQRTQVAKLENMFAGLGEAETKTLTVVLKTDVRGSLEAISAALNDLGNKEVEVRIVGDGVGGITENDINLALTSGAVVLGFNVRADAAARRLAEREQVEIRYYSIIYQLIDDVKSALSGMLDPERVEQILGVAEVRDVFRSPKFGQVAGCMVLEGTVYRNKPIRVLRENVVIFEGELESLRRFKDDVAEVRNGVECGIGVKNYDVKVGDQIEVFEVKEVARAL